MDSEFPSRDRMDVGMADPSLDESMSEFFDFPDMSDDIPPSHTVNPSDLLLGLDEEALHTSKESAMDTASPPVRGLSLVESSKKPRKLPKATKVSSKMSEDSPVATASSTVCDLSHAKSNRKPENVPKATKVTGKAKTISSSKPAKVVGRTLRSTANKTNYDMRFHPMDEYIPRTGSASGDHDSDANSDTASGNASDGSNNQADLVKSTGGSGTHVGTAYHDSIHSS